MITEHIDTWDTGEGMSFSLYKNPNGDGYDVWFKVGVAAFQVPQDQLTLLAEMALYADEQIKELDNERDLA